MMGFRWEEKNKARKWSLSLLTSAYVSIAGQLCLWPLDCELLKDSTRYVLPLEWIWHLGSCRHERTSMFLRPDGLLKINTSDSWSVQELSVLLWLWSRPSSSIGRHSLMSIFSSSTFFDFLLEGRSESWVFAMTYTFPLLLAKCNCLISGRANRAGYLPLTTDAVCYSDCVWGQEKRLERTYRPDERPVATGLWPPLALFGEDGPSVDCCYFVHDRSQSKQ